MEIDIIGLPPHIIIFHVYCTSTTIFLLNKNDQVTYNFKTFIHARIMWLRHTLLITLLLTCFSLLLLQHVLYHYFLDLNNKKLAECRDGRDPEVSRNFTRQKSSRSFERDWLLIEIFPSQNLLYYFDDNFFLW